jgi:hypothetical protein
VAKRIACVVEGHGEVEAVPIIIRRIAAQLEPPTEVRIDATIRTPKSRLVKQGELERAVEFAARKTSGQGGILIVLDSDDDCPAQLGPALLDRAQGARPDLPVAVVLAKREFESWFVAAAESLSTQVGLPPGLDAPADPEAIRGAKEWLTARMQGNRVYSSTLDQPAIARFFNLEMAMRSDSFDKFYRETRRVLMEAQECE